MQYGYTHTVHDLVQTLPPGMAAGREFFPGHFPSSASQKKKSAVSRRHRIEACFSLKSMRGKKIKYNITQAAARSCVSAQRGVYGHKQPEAWESLDHFFPWPILKTFIISQMIGDKQETAFTSQPVEGEARC